MDAQTFTMKVNEIIDCSLVTLTGEERSKLIRPYCEAYQGDPVLVQRTLNRIADWILAPDLKSRNKRNDECPVYTAEQLIAKDRKRQTSNEIDLTENAVTPNEFGTYDPNVIKRYIQEHRQLGTNEIAKRLNVSRRTIQRYMQQITKEV